MKKLYILLFSILFSALSFGQDMIITGVFDGPLTGGTPKVIEFYVVNDIADLSAYGFGSANNGGGTDGQELTFNGSATAGDVIYVTDNAIDFSSYFGFASDYTSAAAAINGDDAIELFFNGSVIDTFGDINVDGTGTAWDYLDGWAYRNNDTGPDGSTFILSNWSFSGINVTDGCTTNGTCGSAFPIGTFTYIPSTDPTLYLVDGPASGSIIEVGPEDLAGDLEFGTTNFVVDTPSAGDGYIKWSIINVTDGGTIHASGDIFDTSQVYPFAALDAFKTYTLNAELLDNNGVSLSSPVVYTITANTLGYLVVSDIAALRGDVISNGAGSYYEITGASLVSHTDSYFNRHWVQDTNISGILIYDSNNFMTTYNVGDNVTGLKGQTEISNGLLRLVPSVDSGVVASSGNTVTPQIVTIPDFNTNYETYESELIKLENVTFDAGDGVATFSTGTNYDVSSDSGANIVVLRTDFFTADYIGEIIPSTQLPSLTAVAGRFNMTAQIYARSLADITLDTKFNQIDGFGVYPNPTSLGYVHISSKNSARMDVTMFDILGKQVLNKTLNNNTLDVSHLTSGIYIMKVAQDNAISTKKLVIQ